MIIIIIIIIIIIVNYNWVVNRWQWLFYMYTKYEIGYYIQNMKLITVGYNIMPSRNVTVM